MALLGNGAEVTVLPLVEICFTALPPGRSPALLLCREVALGYPGACRSTSCAVPADLPADLTQAIVDLCRRAFLALECRDWCRIDVRLDTPWATTDFGAESVARDSAQSSEPFVLSQSRSRGAYLLCDADPTRPGACLSALRFACEAGDRIAPLSLGRARSCAGPCMVTGETVPRPNPTRRRGAADGGQVARQVWCQRCKHDLQHGRDGNRDDDTQQAKERPTNQNRDHHDDRMQPRFPAHDAWAQIHAFEQLPADIQQDNTQDTAHTRGITQ